MLKRIGQLIRENVCKLKCVPRNAYMEREALLLKRVELLHVKEIIDELQTIIDNRIPNNLLRRHIEKVKWNIWRQNQEPFYLTMKD